MQFFRPEFFLWLWLIPAAGLVFFLASRIWLSRIKKFGDIITVQTKLIPSYRSSYWRTRGLFVMLVFLFSILALARPQWGEEKKKVERKGVDIIFLLDTSLSMLAEDIKPNRLEKAKLEIKSFVYRLEGDRVGMVAFAGAGFLQAPLTLDYSAFFLFLDAINTGYIPDPGTSLERAIRVALKSFPEESMKHKAIILFSDGEDHEGSVEQAIQMAKDAGSRIYTIGTATAEGEPIPLKDDTGRKAGYKKDRQGQVVITKLNQPVLEKIAQETGGIYVPSTPGEQEIDLVLRHLESLGQRKFKEKIISEKEDHYQILIILAFLFLILDLFVRRTKKTKPGTDSLAVLLLFFLLTGFIETKGTLTDEGEKLYHEKKFESALESYRKAQVKDPEDPYVLYNLGATLYKMQEYQEAQKNLEAAVGKARNNELKAKALYNNGNALYRLGKFEEAIESYKKALEIDPQDQDSKFNLEFLQKSKNRFDKKNQDKQKEDQKKDQKKDQQEQQQKNQKQDQQQQQKPQQKQDQEKQDQQQPQQKKDEQDKKEEPEQGDQEGDQKSQKPDKGDEEKDEGGADKKEEEKKESEGDKGEQPQEPKNEQGEQEQNAKPEPKPGDMPEDQSQQEQKPSGGGQEQKPLQGQMTKQNALQVLDALMDSEKEFQDLRRPPKPPQERVVEKDW